MLTGEGNVWTEIKWCQDSALTEDSADATKILLFTAAGTAGGLILKTQDTQHHNTNRSILSRKMNTKGANYF